MILKNVHPFPARMASEIAFNHLSVMRPGSIILDPMVGSGTVLRSVLALGHKAMGCDIDPLAVLMSGVSTRYVAVDEVDKSLKEIISYSKSLKSMRIPWIDDDIETSSFVDYWFHPKQQEDLDLRRIARSIYLMRDRKPISHLEIAKICLSN